MCWWFGADWAAAPWVRLRRPWSRASAKVAVTGRRFRSPTSTGTDCRTSCMEGTSSSMFRSSHILAVSLALMGCGPPPDGEDAGSASDLEAPPDLSPAGPDLSGAPSPDLSGASSDLAADLSTAAPDLAGPI